MKHYITLPNGRAVSIGTYAKAFKAIKAAPPEALFPGFDYFPLPAREILAKIRDGIHDRINRHLSPAEYARINDNDRYFTARRLANDVNSRTLIRESSVRHLPKNLLARIASRITPDSELN